MKQFSNLVVSVALMLIIAGCAQVKNIAYFQNKAVNEPETKEKPIFKVTFDVIGDYETQHKVSDFLKSNGIAYKVVSQVKA